MILTLMLVILTATLVIVIIGFVMDRMEMAKLKSGMRTLNKRIKRLERAGEPIEGYADGFLYTEVRGTSDDSLDTKTDSETQTPDGGDVSLETDDTVQNTGD